MYDVLFCSMSCYIFLDKKLDHVTYWSGKGVNFHNKILNGSFLFAFPVGVEADEEMIELLLSQVKGKDITELVAAGREKLASVPSGGGGVAVAAAATAAPGGGGGGAPAAEAKKEEKVEEKEESDDDVSCLLCEEMFRYYRDNTKH